MNDTTLAPTLASSRSLTDLEAIIEQGLSTFVEIGNALLEVRDRWLYRERGLPPPVPSVLSAATQAHSQKPSAMYELIERLYPACSYVGLFARNTREGWDAWGNEV